MAFNLITVCVGLRIGEHHFISTLPAIGGLSQLAGAAMQPPTRRVDVEARSIANTDVDVDDKSETGEAGESTSGDISFAASGSLP